MMEYGLFILMLSLCPCYNFLNHQLQLVLTHLILYLQLWFSFSLFFIQLGYAILAISTENQNKKSHKNGSSCNLSLHITHYKCQLDIFEDLSSVVHFYQHQFKLNAL